jgi:hypothetical protein
MSDRGKRALERIIGALLPTLAAYVTWDYTVLAARPGPPVTVDLVTTDTANPFGPLTNITLWPGPDGGVAVPTAGKLVRVRFTNGDQTKPEICGLDPTDTPAIVYQFGLQVLLGSAAATPIALALPITTLDTALGVWAAAVATALQSAGFPITAPTATLQTAILAAITATPTVLTKAT